MPFDRFLSVDEIVKSMAQSRGIARKLIDVAVGLERWDRLPRACVLYYCSAEELARFYTLELAGRQLCHGVPPDWPSVWGKLRNHDVRIADGHARLRNERGGPPENNGSSLRLSDLGVRLLSGCGPALAADSEISLSATRALALRMLADADLFGDDAAEIRATLSEDSRQDLAIVVNSVVYALEQARQQGCSKENVVRYLDRIAFADDAPELSTPDAG